MKKSPLKILLTFSFAALIILFSACLTQKEKAENKINVVEFLNDHHYRFIAEQANPMRANIISQQLRNLNGSYDLKISPDSVNSYLPYFGVSRQAEYGSTNSGLQFVSTDFDYVKKELDNGKFQITITPKDQTNPSKMFLEVFSNGSANLNVTSYYRDPISFTGRIEKY